MTYGGLPVTWLLRFDTAFASLVDRLAGDTPSRCERSAATPRSAAPRAVALISIGTLGVVLLTGHRRFDALLEAVAAWGEAHDLTWIE
jgi:hypothetical protein